jgi:hypothetical protein
METDDMDAADSTPIMETGWLPTTPVGDTYLRRFLHNWAGMCAATAESLGGHSQDLSAMRMADRSWLWPPGGVLQLCDADGAAIG